MRMTEIEMQQEQQAKEGAQQQVVTAKWAP